MKKKVKIITVVVISLSVILVLIFRAMYIYNDVVKFEVASAFYPEAEEMLNLQSLEYILKMKSTNKAYEDILSKKADIIIATEPSDEQKEMIEKSGISLEFKTLYLEPLAILINSNNDIDNLSIEQIQQIYYGSVPNWNTYQLEKNNGSQTCFESIVKNNELGNNHYEINTMPKIVDKVALDVNGIGYAFYSYYSKMHTNDNAKIIKVNGKEIEDENYPLLFEVYLIYKTDNSSENILKMVNWLCTEYNE